VAATPVAKLVVAAARMTFFDLTGTLHTGTQTEIPTFRTSEAPKYRSSDLPKVEVDIGRKES
jgi:hypothetical protein